MINPMRQRAIDGLKVGDMITFARTFTQEETEHFGDLTRDYNPVHYEVQWSTVKGFDGLICHGLLVGSMICEIGGQIGWLASGMTFKFMQPVYIGDTVTCTFTIQQIEKNGRAKAEAAFFNQKQQQVCYALLTGRLPLSHERELLKTIAEDNQQVEDPQ